jgi:xylulokinase
MSLMGIDIGTTGTKAIAFSEEGKILSSSYKEYNLLFPNKGWVEFDTEDMWKKIFDVIRDVNSDEKIKKDPVEALAPSTIGESFTPIDKRGNILYNTIYSTDARSTMELEEMLSIIPAKDLYYITGLPPQYVTALNKILWLKNNEPDIFSRTHKILFTEELLQHKLGMRDYRINYPLSSTSLFFDLRGKKWSMDILDKFELDPDLFAIPAPSGTLVGKVSPEVSEELGFKGEVSIVTGGHDQQCAAFGVGAISGGIAADGMGTVECVVPVFDEIIMKDSMFDNDFSTRAHVVEDKYVTFAYNFTAGSVLKWYRDKLAPDLRDKAVSEGIDAYNSFFSGLDHQPSGLYTLPYFSGSGTPRHDPITKGTIIGLGIDTERKDIFKSIVEGTIFEIGFNMELLEKSGIEIKELRAVGGGSRSDFWLHLKSSILDKTVKRMDIDEAGCLATMMLAGSAIGKFSIAEAQEKFVKTARQFDPDPAVTELYRDHYHRYKKIYDLVSELYS